MSDGRDELIDRVVEELSALPPVNPAAKARILEAVAAPRRGTPDIVPIGLARSAPPAPVARRRWAVRVSLPMAAALALAAGIGGYVARGASLTGSGAATVASNSPARAADATGAAATMATLRAESVSAAAARLVAYDESAAESAARPVQFVLDARAAKRVVLVGDFNNWDATRTPMHAEAVRGVWTVTLPLTPGRHTYAFIVDDSVWTLDPRAPHAKDADFGVTGSVILVGAP